MSCTAAHPCANCLAVHVAVLAAVQEGARQPDPLVALVHGLCAAWLCLDDKRITAVIALQEKAGHLQRGPVGYTLTGRGREQFEALMHLPLSGLSGGHLAFSLVRLASLHFLPPAQRAGAREQITRGWREGAHMLAQATGRHEPGDLLRSLLSHQVALLDGLFGTFNPVMAPAAARSLSARS